MAARCENCNKGSMWGHRVSHAKNRTNHQFKPNLQSKTIEVNGRRMKLKLCTNCIKLMKKIEKEKAELVAVRANIESTTA